MFGYFGNPYPGAVGYAPPGFPGSPYYFMMSSGSGAGGHMVPPPGSAGGSRGIEGAGPPPAEAPLAHMQQQYLPGPPMGMYHYGGYALHGPAHHAEAMGPPRGPPTSPIHVPGAEGGEGGGGGARFGPHALLALHAQAARGGGGGGGGGGKAPHPPWDGYGGSAGVHPHLYARGGAGAAPAPHASEQRPRPPPLGSEPAFFHPSRYYPKGISSMQRAARTAAADGRPLVGEDVAPIFDAWGVPLLQQALPGLGGGGTAAVGPKGLPRQVSADTELNLKRIESGEDKRTTIMIRNIPTHYSQTDFFADLQAGMFHSLADFIYLPHDGVSGCWCVVGDLPLGRPPPPPSFLANLLTPRPPPSCPPKHAHPSSMGYAFINFRDPKTIPSFYREWHNRKWPHLFSKKSCVLCYARIQGRQAHTEHFKNTKVGVGAHSSPLVYDSGEWNQGDEAAAAPGPAPAGAPTLEGAASSPPPVLPPSNAPEGPEEMAAFPPTASPP
jgi:hypothetical protein